MNCIYCLNCFDFLNCFNCLKCFELLSLLLLLVSWMARIACITFDWYCNILAAWIACKHFFLQLPALIWLLVFDRLHCLNFFSCLNCFACLNCLSFLNCFDCFDCLNCLNEFNSFGCFGGLNWLACKEEECKLFLLPDIQARVTWTIRAPRHAAALGPTADITIKLILSSKI